MTKGTPGKATYSVSVQNKETGGGRGEGRWSREGGAGGERMRRKGEAEGKKGSGGEIRPEGRGEKRGWDREGEGRDKDKERKGNEKKGKGRES